MTISEKVAYLKGLAEGLDLDTAKSKEAKLISVMIGILEEVGLELDSIGEVVDELGEELDAVSDDLADVEEVLFDDPDEDYDPDEDFFEVECPNCGEDLVIDSSVLESGMVECPGCQERFAVDLSDGDADEDESEE